MVTVKNIPDYVMNPSYKMTHIIAAKLEDGSLQYRQCLGSKGAAKRRFEQVSKRFPGVHFEMIAINDLKK